MAEKVLDAGTVYSEMILRMDKFDAATKTLSAALKKIDEEVDKTKKKFDFKALGEGMESVGRKMSIGLTLPLAAASGLAIENASDLNETISKTQVIFSDTADEITKWGESADTSMGMSQRSALDAASSFALFAKQAGKTGQDINEFAKTAVEGSADLASFFNTSPEEAFTAWQAALRGEAEPIRRYNVLIDDASLRQEAFSQGIIKTTKDALTPQQRILAAQALIIKQTSDAQGDFARTSNGLANQTRILKAEYENASASLGQLLLPYMLKLVKVGSSVLQWFNSLSDGGRQAVFIFGSIAAAAGPLLVIVGKAISMIPALTKGFNTLNLVMKANPILLVVGSLVALVAWYASTEEGADTLSKTLTLLKEGWEAEVAPIKELIDTLAELNPALVDSGSYVGILKDVVNASTAPLRAMAAEAKKTVEFINWVKSKGGKDAVNSQQAALDAQLAANKKFNDQDLQKHKETQKAKTAASEEWLKKQQEIGAKYTKLYEDQELSANEKAAKEYQRDLDEISRMDDKYLRAKGYLSQEQARAEARKKYDNAVAKNAEEDAGKVRSAWEAAFKIDSSAQGFVTKMATMQNNIQSGFQQTAAIVTGAITSMVGALGNLLNSIYSAQIQNINNQYSQATEAEKAFTTYQDQKDAESYSKMSASEKKEYDLKKAADASRLKAEEKKNKKIEKLQKKQNKINLVSTIANIGMNTALAIMNVWAKWAAVPAVAAVLTAAVSALSTVEIAAAYAAAAPGLATGGLVKQKSGGTQIVAGEGGADEYVIPSTELVMSGIARKIAALLPGEVANSKAAQQAGSGSSAGSVDFYQIVPVEVKVKEDVVCSVLFGWSRNGQLLTAEKSVVHAG